MRSINVAALVVLFGPIGCDAAEATHDDCEAVAHWIDEHREKLPSTYDEIIPFPEHYRSAIFGALSPIERSALFKEQFARYRLHNALTDEQRAALDRIDTLVSPALYARDLPDDATTQALRTIEREALQAFGAHEAQTLIARLGPPDALVDVPICECSKQSDWCFLRFRTCRPIRCIAVNFCGSGLRYRCDGMCGM